MQVENKITKNFIIGTFVTLYVLTSSISTIHVIDFFELSNPKWLAITLALAFEVGAAASLASIIALKKMNKGIVWVLFIILTAMQAMGNAFFAYTHLTNYQPWIELFGFVDSDPIEQKRILSIVSGAILPLVALGFIKSLVDYIRPEDNTTTTVNDQITDSVTQTQITDSVTQSNLNEEDKLPEIKGDDLEDEPTALVFTPHETSGDSDNNFEPEPIEKVIEEPTTENNLENYPVYDKTNEIKNNGIENIMVFTKDGGQ